MKKLLVILICLLSLAGCSNKPGYAKVSDGDEVIFEGPNIKYTKEELFDVLKLNSQTALEEEFIENIAKDKGIDTESFDNDAQDYVDAMIEYGLESTIISYYGSVEAFKEMYKEQLLETALVKNYVEGKYDEYKTQDSPKLIQTINFEDEETAVKFMNDVNGGMSFEEAATENGYTSDVSSYVVLASDSLATGIRDYVDNTDKLGLSTIISDVTSSTDADGNATETTKYYLVNVVENDVENFKEQYIETKASEISLSNILDALLKEYNIEFFDQDLYDVMSAAHEGLK